MKKRFLAGMLGIVMTLSMLPTSFVLADTPESIQDLTKTSVPISTKDGVGELTGGASDTVYDTVYYGGKPWYVLDKAYSNGSADNAKDGVLLLSKYVFSSSTPWMAYYYESHTGGYLGSDIRGYLSGKNTQAKETGAGPNTYTPFRNAKYYGDTPSHNPNHNTTSGHFNYWLRSTVDTATAERTGGPYYIKDLPQGKSSISEDTVTLSAAEFDVAKDKNELYTKDGENYTLATTWTSGTSYYYDTAPYKKVDVSQTGFAAGTTYYTFKKPGETQFIWVGDGKAGDNVAAVCYYAGYEVSYLDSSNFSDAHNHLLFLAGESTENYNFAKTLGLNTADRDAILATSRSSHTTGKKFGGVMDEDTFFLLNYDEANPLSDAVKKAKFPDEEDAKWWLRSNVTDEKYPSRKTAYVDDKGGIEKYNSNATGAGIRPAFNLNPAQVLFTSAAADGKAALGDSAVMTPLANANNTDTNAFKLTLLDSSMDAPVCTLLNKNADGTYTIGYSGGIQNENNYVSAVVMDADGNICGYAKLGDAAAGIATIEMPDGVELGNTAYNLYIFNEKCSTEETGTDYASALTKCSFFVLKSIEVTPKVTEYTAETKFEKSDITVTATYVSGSDNKTLDLDVDDYEVAVMTSYDLSEGFQLSAGERETQELQVTVKVNEEIEKTETYEVTVVPDTPEAGDFTFEAPKNLIFDGTVKEANVAVKSGVNGMGNITVKYYDKEGNEVDAPINVGTYTVGIDVRGGTNYAALEGITDSSWKFTISETGSETTPDDENATTVIYGDMLKLKVNVTTADTHTIELVDMDVTTPDAYSISVKPEINTVDFYCNGELLDSVAVKYDNETAPAAGSATLKYDTTNGKLRIGKNTIIACYGGSMNMSGSETQEFTVIMTERSLALGEEFTAKDGTTITGPAVMNPDCVTVNEGGMIDGTIVPDDTTVSVPGKKLDEVTTDNGNITFPTGSKVEIGTGGDKLEIEAKTDGITVDANGNVNVGAGQEIAVGDIKVTGPATVDKDGGISEGATITVNGKEYIVESGTVTVNPDSSVDISDGTVLKKNEGGSEETLNFPNGGSIDAATGDVTANNSPGGGSGSKRYPISKPKADNGSVTMNTSNARPGSTVTITVKPEEGYELDKLTVTDKNGNEIELTDNGDGTYSFRMPRSKVVVDAVFTEVEDAFTETEQPGVAKGVIVLTIGSLIVNIDGELMMNDVAPVIRGERTMLPIRVIANALGATVEWDDDAQKVTITKGETVIEIFIGQPFALVNGEPVLLDAPAFIENDRTYLPLRFIVNNLGAEVIWDDAAKTVTIIPAE